MMVIPLKKPPGIQILIADDSSALRERIKSLVNSIDNVCVVGEAENGLDALRLIREKEPDLVILDIHMPGMNGIEVLKQIREMKMNISVCIFTNYTYPQYKKRCIEEGADYFLSKSEDFEEIKIIITDMLRKD